MSGMTDWSDKTADEIVEELKAMIESMMESRSIVPWSDNPIAGLGGRGTIDIIIPPEQWHALRWLGWWPDMPPALDLWRLDVVATDPSA